MVAMSVRSLPPFRSSICDSSESDDTDTVAQDTYEANATFTNTNNNSRDVECRSAINLASGRFAFALGTKNVTLLDEFSSYDSTPISRKNFPAFVMNSSRSYERLVRYANYIPLVIDTVNNFPQGFFDSPQANFLHARLCASVALALKYHHTHGPYDRIDFDTQISPEPLYRPLLRAFIREGTAWAIASTFAGITFALCVIGACYTSKARIDVKGPEENALRYGVDDFPQIDRSLCESMCDLSKTSRQRDHSAHNLLESCPQRRGMHQFAGPRHSA